MDFLKKFFSQKKKEDGAQGGGKTFTCEKCGKVKQESDGKFVHDGSAFCCKGCCGDTSKGEHQQKTANVCEFC